MVFDVTRPHEILPFAWPRVFLMTNEVTGTSPKDCSVVVVLRHDAIPYALQNELWAKYNFGEVFKADDPATKKPATRNPFWKPAKGDYKVPGIGEVAIGINDLQESGVMFCVCDAAMTVYSAALAETLKVDAGELKKEWVAGILPGIQPVPSGVWAIGRAQENGCLIALQDNTVQMQLRSSKAFRQAVTLILILAAISAAKATIYNVSSSNSNRSRFNNRQI